MFDWIDIFLAVWTGFGLALIVDVFALKSTSLDAFILTALPILIFIGRLLI